MNAEFFILNTLVENDGAMSTASFLNSVGPKRSVYIRRVMRTLTARGFISESSQTVSLTGDGYLRHAALKVKRSSDAAYRIGEWVRWAITTLIAIVALLRTFC